MPQLRGNAHDCTAQPNTRRADSSPETSRKHRLPFVATWHLRGRPLLFRHSATEDGVLFLQGSPHDIGHLFQPKRT